MALKAMRELPDYVMAPGSPDVEGWQVHDRDDHVTGTVIDLVVETGTDLVRYLVVQLCDGKHVLVPMGDLDLDEDMGVIRMVNHTRDEVEALPAYSPPNLTPELEKRYYILFQRHEPAGAAD
ncbi:MAG TPA: PRC-barrel domain-containing protein, partial [Stenomitos sp.]